MTIVGKTAPLSAVRRASGFVRAAVIGFAVLIPLAALSPARADRSLPMASGDVAQLVAAVKNAYPNASILKIEREHAKRPGGSDVYEVKLLLADGQVLKLYFDPATLAPIARHDEDDDDHGHDDENDRRHQRKRGHW